MSEMKIRKLRKNRDFYFQEFSMIDSEKIGFEWIEHSFNRCQSHLIFENGNLSLFFLIFLIFISQVPYLSHFCPI